MKILAISGSARAASTNTALLHELANNCPVGPVGTAGIEISVYQDVHSLPIFSPDLEGTKTPPSVAAFIAAIEQADGVIISSPEYVRAIPGGLKNAIDWLVSGEAIIDKPVALLHGSHRGDDMLASLRLVLGTVTTAFHQEIFLRMPLISKSPQEVQSFLQAKENADQLGDFIGRFSGAIEASGPKPSRQ